MKPKPNNTGISAIGNFIVEAGMLKRTPRSGWSVLGINNSESVADHSFRCAIVGFLLARMEGVSAYKILLMTLFGDIPEARISDLHKMAQRYIDIERAEGNSFKEQVRALPEAIREEFRKIRKEYTLQETQESIIARDADILECLIQAKEYYEQGYQQAKEFMKKAPSFLKTESARNLWRWAKKNDLNNWWFTLSEFKR